MKIRREYALTVRMWKKTRVFSYMQATAYETLCFMEQLKEDDFNLIVWIFEFLNNTCATKREFLRKNNISTKEFSKYAVDFQKIFETIQKTRFYGAFVPPTIESEEEDESMPFDAYLTLLSEKLQIDPLAILEKYTFEQINELWKGIIYVINMQTEEWRKKNERLKLAEKMQYIDKEKIAEQLEKLEEWKKKNT